MRVFLIDDVTPAELAEVKAQMEVTDLVGSVEDQGAAQAVASLAKLRKAQEAKGQVFTPIRGLIRTLAAAGAQKPRSNGKANGEAKSEG